MTAALDRGAPIDFEGQLDDDARRAMPAHLANEAIQPSTALALCCMRATDPYGDPAAMGAALERAKALVQRGADPHGGGIMAIDSAQIAVAHAMSLDRERERVELLRAFFGDAIALLAQAGAEFDSPETPPLSPLWKCLSTGRDELARALMSHGADIRRADSRGRTATWIFASRGERIGIQTALALGADLDAPDHDGRSPLWAALNSKTLPAKQIPCILTLLRRGCEVGPVELDLLMRHSLAHHIPDEISKIEARMVSDRVPDPHATAPKPRL